LPRYRALQERQYAQQADLWLKKGDLKRAMLRARQTLSLNPTNVIATRVRGDLEEIINSSAAMFWRRRAALLMPDATNQLLLASTALKFEAFPYPVATKALKEVPSEARATFAYHYIAGSRAWKMNDLKEAERQYSEALKLDPQNPAARMSLAVVRLHSRDQAVVQDSLAALEMLRSDRSVGLLALRSLVVESFARGDLEHAELLSSQVLTNAQASARDRVLHLNILKAGKRPGLRSFLQETQEQAGKNAPAIGAVAAWMTSSGYAREAIDWLDTLPAEVTRLGRLPLAFADAYVALDAWKELESYLLRGPWPGLDHIRYALLTLATWKQVGGSRQSAAWHRAVQVASASPVDLDLLAKLTGAWGWTAEAEEILWRAADQFADQDWPLQRLEQFYTARRDSGGLHRAFAARMQRNPEDRLARNNLAMISLLRNRDVPDSHRIAAELHQAEPRNPVFTSTHAFSLHLQGRTREGLALLRELGLDQLDDPSMSLYYGVLLAADGQTETARSYLKRASAASMLPEEAALLQRAQAL
jgi:tetratricopeptide (TPR) repeat protein